MHTTFRVLALLSLAAAAAGCTAAARETDRAPAMKRELPEQAVSRLRDVQARDAQATAKLLEAVRAEPRDEAWASARERTLRDSWAGQQHLPKDALRGVECRKASCQLRLAVGQGPQGVQQALAVDQWVAWSQPCAYTLVHPPVDGPEAGTLQVLLHCPPR